MWIPWPQPSDLLPGNARRIVRALEVIESHPERSFPAVPCERHTDSRGRFTTCLAPGSGNARYADSRAEWRQWAAGFVEEAEVPQARGGRFRGESLTACACAGGIASVLRFLDGDISGVGGGGI